MIYKETVLIEKINESKVRLKTSPSVAMELSEHFTFFVNGYKFMPSYKNGTFDGKIRLFNRRDNSIPYGLLGKVAKFCAERCYEMELDPEVRPKKFKIDVDEFIKSTPITDNMGGDITPRDYQIEAVKRATKTGRMLVLSPTGSGKSLIIYLISRLFLKQDLDKKVLIIVPTISLVKQMYGDFEAYSSKDKDFNAEDEVHQIFGGQDKDSEKSIYISTWQSIYQMPPNYFKQFGCIVGDEVHLYEAKSVNGIIDKCIFSYWRFGTTGTLKDAKTSEMVLEGSFGPQFRTTYTSDLIADGTLSELDIQCLLLKYSNEEKKLFKSFKPNYKFEYDYIIMHEKRNKFIAKLVLDQDTNSLVLFQQVKKHGEPLYDLIKSMAPEDRKNKIYFVSGKTEADDRERVRQLTEKNNGVIIVASLGVFSTGVNIKNLNNIFFASPFKSIIKLLQSIGRGLRKADNGLPCFVFDIGDDLSTSKTKKNYTLRHLINRIETYHREKFKYKITEINF